MESYLRELYEDVLTNGKVVLLDCEFKLDDCSVFYSFINFKHEITICLKLKNFYNNPDIYKLSCNKNIDSFRQLIKQMKTIVSTGVIVGNALTNRKVYEKKIKYCNLLGIELEKCWICFEDTSNREHLRCGHFIHTKCAEKYYTINGHFKCGICRENYGTKMIFFDNDSETEYELETDNEYESEHEDHDEPDTDTETEYDPELENNLSYETDV